MKKIAFFVDSLSKGGAERVISNLSNYFSTQEDYDVSLVILHEKKIEYAINKNIKINYILQSNQENVNNKFIKKIINVFLKIKNAKKIMREINPDIVVSFLPDSCFLALIAKRKNNKVIVSVRNDPKKEYESKKDKTLMKLLYPKSDGAVFQTKEAKKYFDKIIKCKSEIISNPINPNFIETPYKGIREKTIVSVGRLEEQKNFKALILAFNIFYNNNNKEFRLIIYGEGRQRKELEELINKLNLNNVVSLPGKVDNIKDKIYKSSAFVLSSFFEGMPNALMEAMAMGLPVISTDCPCGGPNFLIENNENGILVPVNDVQALGKAIERVVNNVDFMNKLSNNAAKIGIDLAPEKVNLKWKNYIEGVFKG